MRSSLRVLTDECLIEDNDLGLSPAIAQMVPEGVDLVGR